jgi:threonine synthase
MQVYGAKVIATPTMQDRWTMVKLCVDQFGWWPIQNYAEPQVGANPYGIEGYKTMAYEIIEQLGWKAPDWVAVPTAVGDALVGIWRGFSEWHDAGWISFKPRMLAAEVFGPLKEAIRSNLDHVEPVEGRPTVAMSAGGRSSGWQALQATRDSEGAAIDASEDEILSMQKALAATEGIYAEASSVLSLIGIHKLRKSGEINAKDTVVAVLSATGLKDPDASQSYLPKVPLIEPTLQDLARTLDASYGFRVPH